MFKYIKFTTIIIVLISLLFSCSSDEQEREFGDYATLKLSRSEINSGFEKFSDTVEINSDLPWELILSQSSDWVEFSQRQGEKGTKELVISIVKNPLAEHRELEVGFETEFFTYPLIIRQEGNNSLKLSKTQIERSYQSFVDSVRVSSVEPWEVEDVPEWIELSHLEGNTDQILKISVSENELEERRSATLKFVSGRLTQSILINQDAFVAPFEIKREGSFLDLSSETMEDRFSIPKDFDNLLFNAGKSFSISLKLKEIQEFSTSLPRIIHRSDGTGTIQLIRDRRDNEGQLYCIISDKNGTDFSSSDGTETLVNDKKWHHVVIVVDTQNAETSIYVDGNREAVSSHMDDIYDSLEIDGQWIIGGNSISAPKGSNWNYGGYIDDLRFWNKALTKNEVIRDARNEISISDNLVADWAFEESESNIIYDSSGEFKGSLIGDAKISSDDNN